MAENETLDWLHRSARRWRIVARLIAESAPGERLVEKVTRNLCTTLRNIADDEPVGAWLLAAAGENGNVEEFVRNCRKHRQYAQLFALEGRMGLGRETIAENVLLAIANRRVNQIALHLVDGGMDMSDVAFRVEGCRRLIDSPVRQLARRWARNPESPPRKPGVSRAVREEERGQLLTMSLLRQ